MQNSETVTESKVPQRHGIQTPEPVHLMETNVNKAWKSTAIS
jgi:hypothetical protein